jgi:alkanesulfonate monooxygenase SsuD/methylene tetrahydromethanopterin reductase-like flavin-dependent oxidoreductase (luciferase family)
MKFSFFHTMPYDGLETQELWPVRNTHFDPKRGQQLYENYIDCIAFAEECGFDWLGCNEHHFSPYGMMANCNLIGAALINRTRNAKLAMIGNLVPMLNPIRVAEEYAMLDVMSGGRLIAGFMRGVPHEYLAYNIAPGESRSRQREAIALIVKAWTEPEPFAWEGEHYQFRAVSIWPRPIQKPHPRMLIPGTTEDSAITAAEHRAIMGMAFISDLSVPRRNVEAYRKVAQLAGWEAKPDDILIGQTCCIAESDDEARELMTPGLGYLNRVLMGPQREAQKIVLETTGYFKRQEVSKAFSKRLSEQTGLSIDDLIEGGNIFCGSPETVVKQMKRVHREIGNGIFSLMMKVGNIPDKEVRRGMTLFRDRVLPAVHDL